MKNIRLNVEAMDHLLMGVGSILAVYAGAMSIQKSEVARFFMVAVGIGTLLGLLLRAALRNHPATTWDGLLYTLAACACFAFAPQMNGMLPDNGYPFQIIASGIFSWMLVVGSVFCWRDQTLTFQVVPGLSILGLAGAYDLKESPLLFFAFLLCAASLFFRAHARSMAAQAEEALLVGHHAKTQAERDAVVRRAIDSGAWKWMAGPEWALGSALAIVLLSLIGAPIIQKSVEGVSGIVTVTLPQLPSATAASPSRFSGASTRIGRGPAAFRNVPVLRIHMSQPGLLRGRTMETYLGSGWSNRSAYAPVMDRPGRYWLGSPDAFYQADEVAPGGKEVGYRVTVLSGLHGQIYTIGEPLSIRMEGRGDGRGFRVGIDGAIHVNGSLGSGTTYDGTDLVVEREPGTESSAEPPNMRTSGLFQDVSMIPTRVQALAREITSGATTDYEKAKLIQAEIERRCNYNLRAAAVPSNQDAVEHFLFESKEGYCDLFASAMALLARSAGLTARVCTGFIASEPDVEQGSFIARDSNAHMWAEVYFRGLGWVKFDPTEGAENVTPASGSTATFWTPARLSQLVDTAIVVCLAAILGIAGWTYLRPRRRASTPARSATGRLYESFQRSIERRTGKPRRFSQTPREYVRRVWPELGALGAEAIQLTELFERAFYASDEPTDEALSGLAARVKEFRKAAKSKP